MTVNSRILRALQMRRIAETSRKVNPTSGSAPNTPSVLKSLPEHKSLLPLLLSYHIPPTLAKACADRYDRCADQLRSETESKLVPYLVDCTGGRTARVYSLFLGDYNQALRDWAQSTLNVALRRLKRDSTELGNWDATYPPPIWLPSSQDTHPMFTQTKSQNAHHLSPLSSASAPSHAFPTTYPPPLRPSSQLHHIKWTRLPATSPSLPSTSAIDLDSLCTLFSRSLVIDENPTQSSRSSTSIFSIPSLSKRSVDAASPRTKTPKRKLSYARPPQQTAAKPVPITPSPKTTTSRKLPPFCTSTMMGKTQRKANPSPIPPTKCIPMLSTRPISSSTSPCSSTHPRSLSSGKLPEGLSSNPTSPSSAFPHSPSNTTQDLQILAAQNSPHLLAGPATPPTHSPELFPEPFVVPSIPAQLCSEPFLISAADPLVGTQLHGNYLFNLPFLGHGLSTPDLCASGCFPKSPYDDFNWILPNPAISTLQEPFTGDFFSTQEAF